MSERIDLIEQISRTSIELEPGERALYIDEACGDDTEMKVSVKARVAQYERAREYFSGLARRMGIEGLADPNFTIIEGQHFGKYRIEQQIGQGGMGIVYRAVDTQLDRSVALKFLSPRYADDEDAQIRFSREARATANLKHKNILTVYEVLEYNGLAVIVMEFVDGETLKDKLKRGSLSAEAWLDYATQLADGLSAAHEAGIVHRDLKPANVMVSSDGIVKILDFGLAKLREASMLTRTGATLGTVAYMSPEQARGEVVDHRSDIWSLGVMLYEMMYGELPFRGDYDQAVIYSILHHDPEDARANIEVPQHCMRVIQRALAKNPNDRFQTAGAVKEAVIEPGLTENIVPPFPSTKARQLAYALWGMGIIAIIAFSFWFLYPRFEASHIVIDSIAVIPFENLSPDSEIEYFADGMTDALITHLGQVRALKVIGRTSVIQYKNTNKTPVEIGEELNVDAIVEASVISSNDSLRIAVRLVEASTGRLLWTNSYTSSFDEAFSVLNLITHTISEEIVASLPPREKVRLTEAPVIDPEALKWYLRGKHHYHQLEFSTPGSLDRADSALTKAIAIDSSFADAFGLFARVKMTQNRTRGDLSGVKKMAEKAVSIDPNQPDGNAVLAWYISITAWNWKEAENMFLRALNANPNDAALHRELAFFYYKTNRPELGLEEAKKAVELEPLSFWAMWLVAEGYSRTKMHEDAIVAARELVDFAPNNPVSYYLLGKLATFANQDSVASLAFEKEREITGNVSYRAALFYWKKGIRDLYQDRFEQIEMGEDNAGGKARFYNDVGEIDNALYWLERSIEESPRQAEELLFYEFEKLHSEPRFRALLRKANLEQFLDE